jgi:hypothetical protein
MHIVLTVEDISKLSHSARAELLSLAFQRHTSTRANILRALIVPDLKEWSTLHLVK